MQPVQLVQPGKPPQGLVPPPHGLLRPAQALPQRVRVLQRRARVPLRVLVAPQALPEPQPQPQPRVLALAQQALPQGPVLQQLVPRLPTEPVR